MKNVHSSKFTFISYRLSLLCIVACVVFAGSGDHVVAQEGTLAARGFQSSHSYAFSDIESINTGTGNLLMRLPITSLPRGRNGLTAGVGLVYNSKNWDTWISNEEAPDVFGTTRTFTLNRLAPSPEAGWRYGFEYSLHLVDRLSFYSFEDQPYCHAPQAEYIFKLRVRFPDGSLHEFRPQGYDDLQNDDYFQIRPDGWAATCNGKGPGDNPRIYLHTSSVMNYYSTDATYIRLEIQHDSDTNWSNNPWTLFFPDGRRVAGGNSPQRIYDRNDNYVEIQNVTYNAHPATKLVDQFNRSVIVEYSSATEDYIYSWGFNNEMLKWTVKWRSIYPYKKYNPTDDGLYPWWELLSAGILVVDEIITPTQGGSLKYTFDYNAPSTSLPEGEYSHGWGELSSVTLPSGAQATYEYGLDGFNEMFWRAALNNAPTHKEITYQREYDGTSSPVTEEWDYEIVPGSYGQIKTPDGGVFRETHKTSFLSNPWDSGLPIKTERPDGSKVERLWEHNTPFGADHMNPCLKTEFTSIRDTPGGSFTKTAIVDYTYDKNGNLLQETTYDWVDYQTIPRDANDNVTGIPSGIVPVRIETMSYHVSVPVASDSSTDHIYVYHKPTSPRLRKATAWSEVRNGNGTTVARTEFTFDNATTTGNLTQERSWDSAKGTLTLPLTTANSITTTNQYDGVYGNLTLTTDPQGRQIQYVYGAVNSFPNLYVTEAIAEPGTSFERTTQKQYDFYSGLLKRTIDVGNAVEDTTTYDAFGRTTLIVLAEGKPEESRIAKSYFDAARRMVSRSDLSAPGDGKLVFVVHYDQLGRVRLTRELEDAANQAVENENTGIKVQMRYQTTEPFSYILTSNPYRAATSSAASSEATMGWTLNKIDVAGRVVEVRHYSGAGLPAPWGTNASTSGAITNSYAGNSITITDQDNKVRRSITDTMGRLVRLDEPDLNGNLGSVTSPTQKTDYTYDALSNLARVDQGEQARIFVFSSLSRLVSVNHPESGVTNYEYNDAGNIKFRVDARNVKTTFTYDALNRLKTKSYDVSQATPAGSVPATPTVTYTYDGEGVSGGVPYSKGRLTAVTSSVSATYIDAYDSRGRVKLRRQVTEGQTYSMTYGYDIAGNVRSETYPSGRVITTDYDIAGRLSTVSGQKSGESSKTYLSSIQYAPFGGMESARLGNDLWQHSTYNPRLQPVSIGLGTSAIDSSVFGMSISYGTTNNNGNVRSQTLNSPGISLTQTYLYDPLNRLKSAEETNTGNPVWKQTFTYDRYGNRRIDTDPDKTTPALTGDNPTISTANNRVNQAGHLYDFAGNIKQDARASFTNVYKFDAENRLVDFNNGQTTYTYDAEDQRVKKVEGTVSPVTTVYVYNADRELIAEYSSAGPAGTGTSFLTMDHLGTPRVITNDIGVVRARHDYLPFGDEIVGYGGRNTNNGYFADTVRQQFTAKQRDRESGLDFFLSRYYFSGQGRFISPDYYNGDPSSVAADPNVSRALPYARLSEPQSLNSYAYVTNNPTTLVDADGHDGRVEKISGTKGSYKMRIDSSNPNDAVNVHVWGRRGTKLGKIRFLGDGTVDPDPGIPRAVVRRVTDILRERGIQGRTPNFNTNLGVGTAATEGAAAAEGAAAERPATTGNRAGRARGPRGGGGGTVSAFTILAIVQAVIESINYSREQEQGWYLDLKGELHITNWARFVQTWNPNDIIAFRGVRFKLVDGKLIGINCGGCELKQDPNGELYIEYKARMEPDKKRKKHGESDTSFDLRSASSGG